MSAIDNIISLLEIQHKKQKELTDYLGISKNRFTDWKCGRIKSYQKYLPQIAEFFGVSVDYLLGKTLETESVPSAINEDYKITDDEFLFVKSWRKLTIEQQNYIKDEINTFVKFNKHNSDKSSANEAFGA